MVREQAGYEISEAALLKSIRTWPFDCYRFAEANPIRKLH